MTNPSTLPRRKRRAWLELFRVPNLFTVPGDPVAGMVLARAGGASAPLEFLAAAAGASVLLYMMGLALNDWADQREDAAARPNRPIPSGRLSSRAVLLACLLLTAGGILLGYLAGPAAAGTAALLALAVLFYDLLAKRIPVFGILVMGACRGLSLLLGAVAAGWRPHAPLVADPVLAAAIALTLYVAAFSRIAAGETGRRRLRFERWLPPLAVAAAAVAIPLITPTIAPGFLALILVLLAWTSWNAAKLGPEPEPPAVQRSIKACIMGMFVFQAALCGIHSPNGLLAAALILMALPVSLAFARRFYVT